MSEQRQVGEAAEIGRWRWAVVVGAPLATFAALVAGSLLVRDWAGIPGAVSLGLAVALGLALSAVLPRPREVATRTTWASLHVRRWWSFALPRTLLGLLLLVLGLIVATVIYAIRMPAYLPAGGAQSTWLLISAVDTVAVLALIAARAALGRISSEAATGGPEWIEADRRDRTVRSRVVIAVTALVMFVYFGFFALSIGQSLESDASALRIDGLPNPNLEVGAIAIEILGGALLLCGISALLAAAVLGTSMLSSATTHARSSRAVLPE